MAHKFQAIFDQVTALLTGLPTTGQNVVTSRHYPFKAVPALAVYLGAESAPDYFTGPAAQATQSIQIEIAIKGSESNLDNVLLQIKSEIYNALINAGIDGVIQILPSSTTEPQLTDGGQQVLALTVYEWAITYRFNANDINL